MSEQRWRKSSASVGNPQQCVEVRPDPSQWDVRDSKNPTGRILTFPRDAFADLLRNIGKLAG